LAPETREQMIWYSLAISLHVIASFLWIAPFIHRILVVAPLVPRRKNRVAIARHDSSRVSDRFGWTCLAIAVLSGVFVLYYQGVTISEIVSGRLFVGDYGRLLGAKLMLTVVLIVLQFFPAPRRLLLDWLAGLAGSIVIGLSAVMIR
jgi:hypothetical protein